MNSLFWYEVRSRIGAIVGWGIGLALYSALYTSLYPQMADQMAALADLPIYRFLGVSLLTFEGYLSSTVMMFLSVLLGIYAVTAGTNTLAGEEEEGTLELLVTTRLKRWQVVTAKAAALAVVLLGILLIGGLGIAFAFTTIADQVDTEVTAASVFRAFVAAWPLVVALAMLALFLGAFMPTRRVAQVSVTLLFAASYFGKNIAGMVGDLEWLRPFSLFTYYDTSPAIFAEGPAARDVAVLAVAALLFFGAALLSFERRDLTVGAWPWARGRRGRERSG